MELRRISDLENYSEAEIKKALKHPDLDIKAALIKQMTADGKKKALSLDEYDIAIKNRTYKDCHLCRGKGMLPEDDIRSVGTVHASSAHQCRLRLFYDVTGDVPGESSISPTLQICFAIGHAIHEAVQGSLHRAYPGKQFEDELTVDLPEALVYGSHTDGVFDFGWARAVLEIKTINPRDFAKLTKPKKEHEEVQTIIYSKGLDVPLIILLYISKDWPHDMKQYVVPFREKHWRTWMRNKIRPVEDALDSGEPPYADASSYECKQCPYEAGCPQTMTVAKQAKRRLRRK